MFDVKDIIEKVNNEGYNIIAIRHLSEDEEYEIGDICRNSFDWNYELDCSSYETENPVELDGTCGYAIFNFCDLDVDEIGKAELLISRAMEEAIYVGKPVIIAGHRFTYGNDDNEVIIEDAEVIAEVM